MTKRKVTQSKKTYGALCKEYGISRNTLTAWIDEGINPQDSKAMSDRVAVKHTGGGKIEGGTEMQRARLRKLRAEAHTAELRAQEMEGKLISLEEVEAAFFRIGAATKATLMRMICDLPPTLYGMSTAEIQKKISSHVDGILQTLHDPNSVEWKK